MVYYLNSCSFKTTFVRLSQLWLVFHIHFASLIAQNPILSQYYLMNPHCVRFISLSSLILFYLLFILLFQFMMNKKWRTSLRKRKINRRSSKKVLFFSSYERDKIWDDDHGWMKMIPNKSVKDRDWHLLFPFALPPPPLSSIIDEISISSSLSLLFSIMSHSGFFFFLSCTIHFMKKPQSQMHKAGWLWWQCRR